MVFDNLNQSIPLLPSPEQILKGIILGQVNQYKYMPSADNLADIFYMESEVWNAIFKLGNSNIDFKKPLTP